MTWQAGFPSLQRDHTRSVPRVRVAVAGRTACTRRSDAIGRTRRVVRPLGLLTLPLLSAAAGNDLGARLAARGQPR